jgi:hypothetical protein
MMSEAKRKRIIKARDSALKANQPRMAGALSRVVKQKDCFTQTHVESFSELIQSISESLRHQDGETIQNIARLCGLNVTYLGNFNYEVKHG